MWTFPALDQPTIFIAAPGDVKYLRSAAVAEIEQLQARRTDPQPIAIYDWMVDKSESGFDDWIPAQGQIPLPSDPNCRAVICAFGERIGTPLPADFPLTAIGAHAHQRSRRGYGAAMPYDEANPPADGFAITGTTFEYLAALNASQGDAQHAPPVLLLFIGDNSLRDDTDLLDANFGGRRLYESAQGRYKPSELRRWETASYLPQLAQIRHFCRYVQDQGVVVRIVPDALTACQAIRRFLIDKLGLRLKADERDPFKGLESYGIEDADLLYGRDQERREVIAELKAVWADPRRPNALCVLGASGSGKSSFLKAGLFADLQRPVLGGGTVGLVLLPRDLAEPAPADIGSGAVAALLTRALHAIDANADTNPALQCLAEARADLQPARAVAALVDALRRRGADWRLLLGIDQFEEVLDQWAEHEDDPRWGPLLQLLLAAALEPRIAVAYTLQLNRTERIASDPLLGPFWTGGGVQLLGFPRQGLKAILANPFAFKDLRLAPDLLRALHEQILAFADRGDAHSQASLLPLVSMTLRRLYDAAVANRPTAAGPADAAPETELALADYREQTDVAGAIAGLAAEARAEAKADDETLGNLLRRLVRIRGAERDLLGLPAIPWPDAPGEQALATALTARRLLLREPPDRIRLVHEAVIRHWPAARAWLADERIHLERAAALAADAREWQARGADADFLANAGPRDLDRAADLLARFFDSLARATDAGDGEALLRRYCLALLGAHPQPERVVAVSPNGNRHIHLAVYYDDLDLIRRYLGIAPGCVDCRNAKGATALYLACWDGHLASVEALLAAGADPDAAAEGGWRPLHVAAERGQTACLAALLAAGAERQPVSVTGWQPIHLAAWYGQTDCLAALLAAGADPTVPTTGEGWTCVHLAANGGHVAILDRLLAEPVVEPDALTADCYTPLYVAAANNQPRSVARLIATGRVALDRPNGELAMTALHSAAEEGHGEVAERLLQAGADPNRADRDGRTSLICALDRWHLTLAVLLIRHGADLDLPDPEGRTLLHRCAAGWMAAVGFQYNQEPAGERLTRWLLARGARADVTDANGDSPLRLAMRTGNAPVVGALLAAAPADEAPAGLLHFAARNGQAEVVRLLLARGLSATTTDGSGWTALHEAAQEGQAEVVSLLIEQGADPNALAHMPPLTPLGAAAETGQCEVVRRLLAQGAAAAVRGSRDIRAELSACLGAGDECQGPP